MSKPTGFFETLLGAISGKSTNQNPPETPEAAGGDDQLASILAENQRLQEEAKKLAVKAAEGVADSLVAKAIADDKLVPAQAEQVRTIVLNALATDGGGSIAVVDGSVVQGDAYGAIVASLEAAHPLGLQKQVVPAGATFVETGKTTKPEHTVEGILAMTELGRRRLAAKKAGN